MSNSSVSIIAAAALFICAGVFLPISQGGDDELKRHGPVFTERSIHGSWGLAETLA